MQLTRKKVLKFIREHGLLAPGDKVVVAFSGGADSMALLDILTHLPDFPLQIIIAHLNHCLRGDESAGDELFVRGVAEKYALPLEISSVDVGAAADRHGLSLEEAGRNARRAFFLEIVEKTSAKAVILGHHRDDQSETVLLRLIRGAAGSGLAGMQPRTPGGVFLRPLLCLCRAEIENYLRKGSLPWRDDSSNADPRFLRNRIRHELLPLLKGYNNAMAENLVRLSKALAADEELLDAVVSRAYEQMALPFPEGVRINLEMLGQEPPALRKRLYRKALSSLKGDLRRISAEHLAAIDRLATGTKGGGKLSLPDGVLVIRQYAIMMLTNLTADSGRESWELSIDSCGTYKLANRQTLLVEKVVTSPADWPQAGKDIVIVDPLRLPFPWTIRCCRDGDRFTPLGMRGRKKLKDLFIDRKIPQAVRKNTPLLLCAGKIFWVAGVQLAEKARITRPAGELLRLRLISDPSPDWH